MREVAKAGTAPPIAATTAAAARQGTTTRLKRLAVEMENVRIGRIPSLRIAVPASADGRH